MALTNPTLSAATTTSVDCAVDSDVAGGTLYFLVSTAAASVLEETDPVRFGQSQPAVLGTNNLGTWTDGIFPRATGNQKTGGNFGDFRDSNNYAPSYRLFVVHDALDDGNYTEIAVSSPLQTLNDNEMYAPADTTRFLDKGTTTISRDDPLIQEWLTSGGNVSSDDHTSALPAQLAEGEYTVTFSNPASTITSTARTLTIKPARKRSPVTPKFTSILKTDGTSLDDPSEYWGTYKFGNYLFCAAGTRKSDGSGHGGIRVFDVSDVEGGSADTPVFTDTTRGPDENPLFFNRFLRTIQVKGTPGTPGAEMYALWRSSPYTNTDRDSMFYVYDISDPVPANWGLRSNWAQSHEYLGGPGTPAFSAPLLSDGNYDPSTDSFYASVQRSGLRKYSPADVSTPVINNSYTPRQHETQGNTVDSDPNGYMYVAAYGNGLRIVRKDGLQDTQYGSLITQYSSAANSSSGAQTRIRPWDAVLSSDEKWLFCSMQSDDPTGTPSTSGMAVFDVHDPEKPQLVVIAELPIPDQDVFNGRHDQATVRTNLYSKNGREYLMCGNLKKGVAMWDVSDPTRPVYLGTNTANLDTVGGTIDGIAHVEMWEDNGKIYAAYGDYASLTDEYGSRQLYIDELTLEGDMAFSIGNTSAATGLGGTFINKANSRGSDAGRDRVPVAGDYVNILRLAVEGQPAARTLRLGLYRKDTGALFHSEDVVVDPGGYPFTGVHQAPLASNVPLPVVAAGVTFRVTHVSGGTNLELDDTNDTSSIVMRQVTNPSDSTLPADLATDADYPANDGIIALLGDNTPPAPDGPLTKADFVGTWNVTHTARDAMLDAAGIRRQPLFDALAPYKAPPNTVFPVPLADMIGSYTLDAAAVDAVLIAGGPRGHSALTAMVRNNGA